VRSVAELWERLRARGVRIVGDGGGTLAAPPQGAIFTHPRDTGGLLEFMQAPTDGDFFDARLRPGWSSAFWRDEHPLGIERCSHLTLVVRDLERARALWVDAFEGRPFLERESRAHGTRNLFVAVGDEVVVELAQPVADGSAGRELAGNGEILHAVCFRVRDLARAEKFLRELGMEVGNADGELELGPEQAQGARYRFTQAALPGDPRR
jgi:catechol 2,3-dioxygenase-like lactoylglutathione lyase family enzyme